MASPVERWHSLRTTLGYYVERTINLAVNPLRRGWAGVRGLQEVRLIGFLGDSSEDMPRGLLRVGHFRISVDRGKTIYAFRPSVEGMRAIGDAQAVDDHLRAGGEIPGVVFDDTQVFYYAYQFSLRGKQTTVWQRTQFVSQEQFDLIQVSLGDNIAEGMYRFPPYDRSTKKASPMPPYCNNCATWPRTRGLWTADTIGHLRGGYMERFMRAGATRWRPTNL